MTTPHDTHNPLDAAIQSGANHDVPPEILNRARRHLDVLRERMETRQMERINSHSFTWRRLLAFATPIAALLMAGLIFWYSNNNGSSAAYAAAVRRLRGAENMVLTLITQLKGLPEQRIELTYNNSGDMRYDTGKGIYSVFDMKQKKVLTIDSEHKQATETNLSNLPVDQLNTQTDIIEHLRRMPEKANKELGQKLLNNHLVNGYEVNENGAIHNVWIDAGTHDLVQIDMWWEKMPGMSVTMTNFRLNVPLAPDFFSTAIPTDFQKDAINYDVNAPVDQDLVTLLEMYSAFTPDGTFPATLNPADLTQTAQTFMKSHPGGQGDKGKLSDHPYFQKQKNAKKEDIMKSSQQVARAMVFIMQAKPENNWHYAGKGVKYGDAQTPIAWWKPTGQKNYKVIFGDLSVKDVAAEDIPSAPGFNRGAKH